jgi:hypothetical protein
VDVGNCFCDYGVDFWGWVPGAPFCEVEAGAFGGGYGDSVVGEEVGEEDGDVEGVGEGVC